MKIVPNMRFEIFVFFVTECSSLETFPDNNTALEIILPRPENRSSTLLLCPQYDNDQKLYDQLSKSGGHFDSKLMANTIKDVVLRMNDDFQDQLLNFEIEDGMSNDDPINQNDTDSSCDQKCLKSRHLFVEILMSQDSPLEFNFLNQTLFDSDTMKNFSCQRPEKIIKIGNCRSKVKIDNFKFVSLCPVCRFLYKLPNYCFPRYISTLHCHNAKSYVEFSNRKNLTCIHESWSGRAHGKCVQKTTNLMVMRNKGHQSCPDWTFESLPTPINCECFLNTRSWLKS